MARKSARKPQHSVIHLRLEPKLHGQLRQAADRRRATLVTEIRARLLDSFDTTEQRGFEAIRLDMEVVWARFSARHLRLKLEEELVEKLMRTRDPEIATLARLWMQHKADEERQSPTQSKGATS
jgi:hypothetical protein